MAQLSVWLVKEESITFSKRRRLIWYNHDLRSNIEKEVMFTFGFCNYEKRKMLPIFREYVHISFIIKTAKWYFIDSITSKLMILTSDDFHFMMHLFVIE